jgi:hypothetical protein
MVNKFKVGDAVTVTRDSRSISSMSEYITFPTKGIVSLLLSDGCMVEEIQLSNGRTGSFSKFFEFDRLVRYEPLADALVLLLRAADLLQDMQSELDGESNCGCAMDIYDFIKKMEGK